MQYKSRSSGAELGYIMTNFLNEHRRRTPPRGIRGRTPQGYFLDFYFLSPLSWFSQSFRQDIGQIATWKVFLLLTIYFFMKNVTDFHKMVETGVYLRLQFKTLSWTLCSKLLRLTFQAMKGKGKQEPILTGYGAWLNFTVYWFRLSSPYPRNSELPPSGIGVNKKWSVWKTD